MAEYIGDSGPYGNDSILNGTKGTDYDYDAANKLLWFSSTGSSNTGITLRDAPFIIYEVYAPDSHTNDLSGGTVVYSHTEFSSEVGVIATTLSAWKTDYDNNVTAFTTYKVRATHYKGSNLADVYFADEGEGFSLTGGTEEGITDGDYNGHGSEWVINNTLFSDQVTTEVIIYINFGDTAVGQAETINEMDMSTFHTSASVTLSDSNGNVTSGTITTTSTAWGTLVNAGIGTAIGDILGYQMTESWKDNYAKEMNITLPSGTWSIEVSCSQTSYTSANGLSRYRLNGGSLIEIDTRDNTTESIKWTGLAGSTSHNLYLTDDATGTGDRTHLGGIVCIRTGD